MHDCPKQRPDGHALPGFLVIPDSMTVMEEVVIVQGKHVRGEDLRALIELVRLDGSWRPAIFEYHGGGYQRSVCERNCPVTRVKPERANVRLRETS